MKGMSHPIPILIALRLTIYNETRLGRFPQTP